MNQRTSGPVNAHLTPGPGIYFNAFIHVYSHRAGAGNPLGTNVDVNRKTLSLCPFVASFNSSHAVRDLGRVRQYPPWLLLAAFVDSVGYPRYNPQKTCKQ